MKQDQEQISSELTRFYEDQPEDTYENSHKQRLDFLVSDLGLDQISNSIIGDFGCGYGPIFKRLPKDRGNKFLGFDAADINPKDFAYVQADLSRPLPEIGYTLDVALCFEVVEHVTNPYNLLFEIKKILKPDGTLFLSIPGEKTEHNTIYPALLYPADNFKEFLRQMAFEVLDHRQHNKNFHQEVFTLRNAPWISSKLRYPLYQEKYLGIPPHVVVNL